MRRARSQRAFERMHLRVQVILQYNWVRYWCWRLSFHSKKQCDRWCPVQQPVHKHFATLFVSSQRQARVCEKRITASASPSLQKAVFSGVPLPHTAYAGCGLSRAGLQDDHGNLRSISGIPYSYGTCLHFSLARPSSKRSIMPVLQCTPVCPCARVPVCPCARLPVCVGCLQT